MCGGWGGNVSLQSWSCLYGNWWLRQDGPDELVELVGMENCCLLLGRLSRNFMVKLEIFEYGIKLKLHCLSNEDDLFGTKCACKMVHNGRLLASVL